MDYPQGDGKPDCVHCRGRGVVSVPKDERPPFSIGELTRPCVCVLARDVLANLERAWKGLSKAAPILKSPLRGHETENLWITAGGKDLKEHLRHVAARQGPRWHLLVVSDADLMNSWLSKDIPDSDIFDADVEAMRRRSRPPSAEFSALVDLIDPPALLVIRLGVKAARNKAMCEVFQEALLHREHVGKPTWIVDQPFLRLAEGHIDYSLNVASVIEDWNRVVLSEQMEILPVGGGVQRFSMGSEPRGTVVPPPPRVPVPSQGTTTNLLDYDDLNRPEKPKFKRKPLRKKKGGGENGGDEL